MSYLRPAPLGAVCAALLLTACAVTRVEAPAPMAAPAQFKEQGPPGADTAATPLQVGAAWWELFGDAVLNDLEQGLLINNENLKIAVAQVAGARAAVAAADSAIWPTLSLNLNGTRSSNPAVGAGEPGSTVSLVASSSWELDLWGRLSMAAQGAATSARASEADLAAARLSAQATLAQTYFSLRAAELQEALLHRSVAAYARALELTQARYQGGVAAQTDVLQAQTQLSGTRAQLADAQAQRAQYEHAIAVLLGQAPSTFALAATAQLPAPVTPPDSLPSRLLQRRPDIAAAQLRVQAAYAQIGVADAAFFPTLTLSASAGPSAPSLSTLLSGASSAWSLGTTLGATLLDSGAHRLASDQARATAQQLGASYRQTVLTALQEVEDNLVLARRLSEEVRSQTEALQSSQRSLELVLEQYRAGTVGYLNVTAAQGTALASEISLIGARNRELAAINVLLKNIAGDWTTR